MRRALIGHLQMAFSRVDPTGSGSAPTEPLVRALRTLLASQTTNNQRINKGWTGLLRQLVRILDIKIGDAGYGAVDNLATGWEELLSLVAEAQC